MAITFRDIGLFALCILFPPVAVYLIKGRCDTDLVRDATNLSAQGMGKCTS